MRAQHGCHFFERRSKVITTPHPASDDPVRDERFRVGIEGSGIGMWDLDLSTHRLLWSRITRTLFGVPDDLPLTYELFLSLLEPRDRGRTDKAVRRSVETGCSFDMQYRVDGRSRLPRWVRARGSIVRDERGVPRYLSGLVIDIDAKSRSKRPSGSGKIISARSSRPFLTL